MIPKELEVGVGKRIEGKGVREEEVGS